MNPRYEGKPFLRLLECYILWAIDALPEKDSKIMDKMTPNLRQIYKRDGTWQEIVAAEMHFPEGRRDEIVRNWTQNKERAKGQGVAIVPEDFAQFLADHLSSSRVYGSPPKIN